MLRPILENIVFLNNFCLVVHIACCMEMKIHIELSYSLWVEGFVFFEVWIIPLPLWIDEEQSRVTQAYSEFFLIISLSWEDEIAAILFDFDVNAPESIIISEVVDLGVQTQLLVGLFSVHA